MQSISKCNQGHLRRISRHAPTIDFEGPLECKRVFIEEKRFGVLTVLRRKKKMSDWTESQNAAVPCASNYLFICAVVASQILKDDFQALGLRDFLRQHVHHLTTQDVDGHCQTLQYSPLLVLR